MVGQKHLTIREAKNEIKKLKNELELYLDKKKINFLKTQPGAIQYKDVMVSSSNMFDKLTHYKIRDEECDVKILSLEDSINAYEKYIINQKKELCKLSEDKFKVITLRDDDEYIQKYGRPRTWELISEITGFSVRQSKRIFADFLNF